MNKLFTVLLAGAATLAFSGAAISADEPTRDSGKDVQNQQQGDPVTETGKDVTTEGRDPKKEEFQAEMKKCDAMTGASKKTCTDAAKKKYGQM